MSSGKNIFKWGFLRREHKIRKSVEAGIVPVGLNVIQITEALFKTRPKNNFEMFGFLNAKRIRNGVVKNFGLVSCQKVTQAFAAYLVDSMVASGSFPIDVFDYHGHGTGSSAESNTETTLVTEVDARSAGTPTNPTTYVYQNIGTVTATGTHTIVEHGIFSAASNGTMLDRNLVDPTIDVVNNDEVVYTYQLTVNPEA